MSQQIEINIPELLRKGVILWIFFATLIVSGLITSVFKVPADSQGVILRFGKFEKTVGPGLRFKLPFGIDEHEIIVTEGVRTAQFGILGSIADNSQSFNPLSLGERNPSTRERSLQRSIMTGDLNLLEVEWIVQYQISNPRDWLFEVKDPQGTLSDLTEAIVRTVVGDRTFDEVITIGRLDIAQETRDRLQDAVKKYKLGIRISEVQFKNINPPSPVQASFNEVNQAEQEKDRMINEAKGIYDQETITAIGIAQQKISEAIGYATKRVNEALGDISKFKAMFIEYQKAPEVTTSRLYWERMKEVIPKMGKRIIIDEETSQILPLLQLNQVENGGGK